MSENQNGAVATEARANHAFTEPNPFLSETGHLHVGSSATPMQRTLNEVPAQRESD